MSVASSSIGAKGKRMGKSDGSTVPSLVSQQAVKDTMNDTQKAHIYQRNGKAALDRGDFFSAIDCFNEAISLHPTVVSLYIFRANAHKALNMLTDAYFDYSFACRLEPENGSHYCSRGVILSRLKRTKMALEDLDIACDLAPVPLHFYSRATIFCESGEFEIAIADYTRAVESEVQTSPEIKFRSYYKRASAYFELKQYEHTIEDLTVVLTNDPNGIEPRFLLGKTLKMVNDLKRAEEQLSHIILLDRNQASFFAERGDICYRTGKPSKIIDAVYDFDKAVQLLDIEIIRKVAASTKPLEEDNKSIRSNSLNRKGNRLGGSMKSSNQEGSKGDEENELGSPTEIGKLGGVQLTVTEDDRERCAEVLAQYVRPFTVFPAIGCAVHPEESIYADLYIHVQGLQPTIQELGEVFYQRAQARLMLDPNAHNLEAAVQDAMKAISIAPDDMDYLLVTATAYIRLDRYSDAMIYLQVALRISPDNEKALYNFAFCQRAAGQHKNAIEGLTKIIALAEVGSDDEGDAKQKSFSFPIYRAFETRGTLFHELQAHKLALSDLGQAVALNPEKAENYFLRGDCFSKLGRYEQAIGDYNLAEEKGFPELIPLYCSRGMVHRLLGQSVEASSDFARALVIMESNSSNSNSLGNNEDRNVVIESARIRILVLQSLCLIDQNQFVESYDALQTARDITAALIRHLTKQTDVTSEVTQNTLNSLHKLMWILCYHTALSWYMRGEFEYADEVLIECVSEDKQKYCVDETVLGTAFFFKGLAQARSDSFEMDNNDGTATHGRLTGALSDLQTSLQSKWAMLSSRNRMLAYFAIAKIHQASGRHEFAVENFNEALSHSLTIDSPTSSKTSRTSADVGNSSDESAYIYFRRAWSHKSLGNLTAAGADFEIAKNMKSGDPNFTINYKTVKMVQYMEVETEPDLLERFPAVLPGPGSGYL